LVPSRMDGGKGQGDEEAEALAVVLSSFLLDLCQRFPEERTKVVSMLLNRLSSPFSNTKNEGDNSWNVPPENTCSFASLCHATVLCTCALPTTPVLTLQRGIVRRLISSIQFCTLCRRQEESGSAEGTAWPAWLSSGLLLLDVMAQPLAAPSADFSGVDDADEELSTVGEERKQRARAIAQTDDIIFSSLRDIVESTKEGRFATDAVARGSGDSDAKPKDGSVTDEKKTPDTAEEHGRPAVFPSADRGHYGWMHFTLLGLPWQR